MIVREPAVAGTFYPEDPEELRVEIKRCFKEGPGEELKKNEKVSGIISPHAGYVYSGVAAAYAHKALAESGYTDTIILLGPSHREDSTSIWLGSDWSTPLGKIEVDRELGKKIAKSGLFDIDPNAHLQEHSLEVQLPFIQYLCQEHNLKLPKIVPILFSYPLDAELASKFGKILSKTNCNIIVSSDFTHYGMNYRYLPFFGENIKDKIYNLDKGAIEKIEKLDLNGFVNYVNKTGATICGAFPIAIAISMFDNTKGKLLKYYTSGDITGSYNNSVSYAAIEFIS